MNLFAHTLYSQSQTHPQVYDWIRRVQGAGVTGFTSSFSTIRALSNFCYGLDNNKLSSKIKSLNCFVPDNITASFTPLYATYGSSSWMGFNFVPSDLNYEGLQGASGKFLNTGIIPSIAMPSVDSGGLSVYVTNGNNGGAVELGVFGASYVTQAWAIYVDWTDGNSYYDCYGASGGRTFGGNTLWNGFLSGNRYSRSASYIARASNGTYGLQTVSSTTGISDQTIPIWPIFCMCADSNGSPNSSYYSTKRISFAAVHEGYTPSELQNFFFLVNKMRFDLGGGWIA